MTTSAPTGLALGAASLPTNLSDLTNKLATGKHTGSSLMDLYISTFSDLPTTVLARSPPHLTHRDLIQIMDAKLTFGQNRPALRGMIAKLDPEDVQASSTAAFAALLAADDRDPRGKVESAMTSLIQLRGVGPATASLILSLVCEEVPFFSDEAAVEVLEPAGGRKALKYTIKEYWTFWEEVGKRVEEDEGGDRRAWERRCWARKVMGTEEGRAGTKKRAREKEDEIEETDTGIKKEESKSKDVGRPKRAKKAVKTT